MTKYNRDVVDTWLKLIRQGIEEETKRDIERAKSFDDYVKQPMATLAIEGHPCDVLPDGTAVFHGDVAPSYVEWIDGRPERPKPDPKLAEYVELERLLLDDRNLSVAQANRILELCETELDLAFEDFEDEDELDDNSE